MSWIESHQELGRHPKTRRLARLLDTSLPAAVGHLQFLWWWALDFAQDGDLAGYEEQEIADAALWEGDACHFVDALARVGFLDMPDEGGWSIHDWQDYAGKLIEHRRANAERQRTFQAKRKGQNPPPTQPDPTANGHVTTGDTSPNSYVTVSKPLANTATVQDSTVPENKNNAHAGTREESAPALSPVAPQPAPPDPQWDEIDPASNHTLLGQHTRPAPKPSKDTQTVTDYQAVVDAYPLRYGAGPDFDAGLLAYALIPAGERPAVLEATRNYARYPDACKEDGAFVMNIGNFLTDGRWRRYQQLRPAAPPGKAARAAPPRAVDPVVLQIEQAQAARKAAAQGANSA